MKKILGVSFISLLAFTTLQAESSEAKELSEPKSILTENGVSSEVKKFSQPKSTLTEDEVEILFDDFVIENKLTQQEILELDEAVLEEFVDYAVDSGAIYNTMEARAEVLVKTVRLQFKAVVAGGKLVGYTTAADLLNHSLQDSPKDLNYASGTAISNQVKSSKEAENIVNDIKKYVQNRKLGSYTTSGSTTLNSTKDLFLAFNKVSYVAESTKNLKTGQWTTTITFKDEYDFDEIAWKNVSGLGQAAVAALTNYAVEAERIGAIVPYNIKITTTHTFYE
ncbi:hypothetical protein ABFY60_27925 [Lysinibacillus pakistanensis]|uniref:hypothetical protein n=1 Tax=Lysinibacillus pakistanensis TaxID=759811 RepID=UPI003D2965B2